MRFFTLPPFLPKKLWLVSFYEKSPFYMQSSARPTGQSLLKISMGLSGIATVLCPSAIAAPLSISPKPLPDTVSQTLLVDSPEARPFSPKPSPSHNALDVQPLPLHLDEAIGLAPTQASRAKLEQAITSAKTQPKTQIDQSLQNQSLQNQSLQNCDHAFTIPIDAASATAIGCSEAVSSELKISSLEDSSETEPEVADARRFAKNRLQIEQEAPLSANNSEDTKKQETEIAGSLDDLIDTSPRRNSQPQLDNELGTIRASPLRDRGDEDLGVLRLLQRAAAPPKPRRPIAFLTGRLGYFNSENAFRLDTRESEQIYQSGLAFAAFPSLSENTSLYAIAETNLGRFEQASDRGYNEVELQLGVRQKLFPSTYAQIGLRNQRFYSFGYEEQILSINYIDTVISHRSIFDSRTWLDSFYQARLGFADAKRSSRFRQTLTLSLNYGISKDLRTSLLYQLDLEDYTQISRYDVYQQVIGTISYRLTPESQISLFGGTRFGNSSSSDPALSSINLDDTFYGAGLTVNLPLF